MQSRKPLFDVIKAKLSIETGPRSRWWQCSSKDLLTWGGSLLAAIELAEIGVTLDQFRTRKTRRIKRLETEYEVEEIALLKLFERYS